MDESLDSQIEQLADLLRRGQRPVVFSGWGISVEAIRPILPKIHHKDPIDFGEYLQSEELRREAWRRYFSAIVNWSDAKPSKGHVAVADMVALGKVSSVITQNVDNLHQKSGVPDEQIIELHGNSTYAACLDCRKRFEISDVRAVFEDNETIPVCDECGGIIKTAVVSFGQPMPEEEMRRAEQETLACDLFLVLGSSLAVKPSSAFPRMAKDNGAILVIINDEPTETDDCCDLVIHASVDETLPAAVARL